MSVLFSENHSNAKELLIHIHCKNEQDYTRIKGYLRKHNIVNISFVIYFSFKFFSLTRDNFTEECET